MTQHLKAFDEQYLEYKRILPKIRYVMNHGITDKNSWEFYINIDKIKPLLKHVKSYYNIQPKAEVLEFIKSIG